MAKPPASTVCPAIPAVEKRLFARCATADSRLSPALDSEFQPGLAGEFHFSKRDQPPSCLRRQKRHRRQSRHRQCRRHCHSHRRHQWRDRRHRLGDSPLRRIHQQPLGPAPKFSLPSAERKSGPRRPVAKAAGLSLFQLCTARSRILRTAPRSTAAILPLRHDLVVDPAVDIGQSKITPGIAVRQPLVVNS